MIIKSLFISLFVIKFLMYLPMVFTTLEIIKNTNTHTHKIYDQTNYTTISRYPKKKCQIILQHFTFIYL